MRDQVSYLTLVHSFLTKFKQGYVGPVRDLPAPIASLRKKLLQEELNELVQAIDRGEHEEILDALVDMQYVLTGTIIAHGMHDVFDEAFKRVHYANMMKTLAVTRHESKRDSTYDIIKPDGWVRPDLSDLVRP